MARDVHVTAARGPSRRRFLRGAGRVVAGGVAARALELAGARRAFAIGDRSLFRFARLALPGLPDPRPTALRAPGLGDRPPHQRVDRLRPGRAAARPIPTCSATRSWCCRAIARFALPPEADIARLRRHITYGGFLLIDSAEGRAGGGFDESVRRLLAQTLPGELPIRIPDEHVLWKSFYVLRGAPGRILAAPLLEGVERDRRLAVVYTQNDLGGALARDGFGRWEHEVIPGGDDQREEAFRLGVNLVMYALCLDYKTEQAHIDYILRTRRLPR